MVMMMIIIIIIKILTLFLIINFISDKKNNIKIIVKHNCTILVPLIGKYSRGESIKKKVIL